MKGCGGSQKLPISQAEPAGTVHLDSVLAVGKGLNHSPSSFPSQSLRSSLVLDDHCLSRFEGGECFGRPLVQFDQALQFKLRHPYFPRFFLGSPHWVSRYGRERVLHVAAEHDLGGAFCQALQWCVQVLEEGSAHLVLVDVAVLTVVGNQSFGQFDPHLSSAVGLWVHG